MSTPTHNPTTRPFYLLLALGILALVGCPGTDEDDNDDSYYDSGVIEAPDNTYVDTAFPDLEPTPVTPVESVTFPPQAEWPAEVQAIAREWHAEQKTNIDGVGGDYLIHKSEGSTGGGTIRTVVTLVSDEERGHYYWSKTNVNGGDGIVYYLVPPPDAGAEALVMDAAGAPVPEGDAQPVYQDIFNALNVWVDGQTVPAGQQIQLADTDALRIAVTLRGLHTDAEGEEWAVFEIEQSEDIGIIVQYSSDHARVDYQGEWHILVRDPRVQRTTMQGPVSCSGTATSTDSYHEYSYTVSGNQRFEFTADPVERPAEAKPLPPASAQGEDSAPGD